MLLRAGQERSGQAEQQSGQEPGASGAEQGRQPGAEQPILILQRQLELSAFL